MEDCKIAKAENAYWTPLPWAEMSGVIAYDLDSYRRLRSGCHMAVLGTTRGGKTTLVTGGHSVPGAGLLANWENVLVLDTTGDPGNIKDYGEPLKKRGKIKGHMRLTVNDASSASREKVYNAIARAVSQGDICIYGDEMRQLADKDFFNLQKALEHIWLFTAKKGVSLVGGTQAPRWVPSPMYDQSKLHFIFGMRDRRAMKRLAEISGDVDTLEMLIPILERYEFAYVSADGSVYRSKFEVPARPPTEKAEAKSTLFHPVPKRKSNSEFRVVASPRQSGRIVVVPSMTNGE